MRVVSELSRSGFSNLDETEDPGKYVRRLDVVGATAFWHDLKQLSYALLALEAGGRVLDVGCGTGDDVRSMARIVGPRGRACGVDSSATILTEARRRSEIEGSPSEFYHASALSLPFEHASFEGSRAERVLQHLEHPPAALSEMVRVCQPGAHIVVIEPDYACLSIVGADDSTTRCVLRVRQSHFASPNIGSQLPGLFRSLGLVDLGVSVRTLQSSDFAADVERISRYADEAVVAGAISASGRAAWLASLEASGKAGHYAQSAAVFVVSGRIPQ